MSKNQHIYDISMPLTDQTPVWPTSKRFHLEWLKNIDTDGVNESSLSFNTHTGTHIDLPYHFIKAGDKADSLSLEQLIGKAMVIEYEGQDSIGVEFLEGIDIQKDCQKLLFKTSNSKFNLKESTFRKDYIALSLEGAEWIVKNRINLVGIDYLSIEQYSNTENQTHKFLLENNIIILEGLVLKDVAEGYYNLFALPLNIPVAEAAPVRAVLLD